ncbi:MAG: hypothetical protein J3K34DRAFT_51096 [Monoraphidium minutum]|nr:MAG: hypothetical protein J3K34DRAFT_51096 [Monoraphidium minutum]
MDGSVGRRARRARLLPPPSLFSPAAPLPPRLGAESSVNSVLARQPAWSPSTTHVPARQGRRCRAPSQERTLSFRCPTRQPPWNPSIAAHPSITALCLSTEPPAHLHRNARHCPFLYTSQAPLDSPAAAARRRGPLQPPISALHRLTASLITPGTTAGGGGGGDGAPLFPSGPAPPRRANGFGPPAPTRPPRNRGGAAPRRHVPARQGRRCRAPSQERALSFRCPTRPLHACPTQPPAGSAPPAAARPYTRSNGTSRGSPRPLHSRAAAQAVPPAAAAARVRPAHDSSGETADGGPGQRVARDPPLCCAGLPGATPKLQFCYGSILITLVMSDRTV